MKLKVDHLLNKSPAYQGIRKLIAVFKTAHA
jgi:hypothetical protein